MRRRRGKPAVKQLFIAFLTFLCLPALTQEKLMRAAVLKDFPPLYHLDESGQPEGMAIDILSSICYSIGYKTSYVLVNNWGEALEALRSGKADIIPGIGHEAEREAEFLFSQTHMETVPVTIFVRSETTNIQGLEGLAGQRVAVLRDSVAWSMLKTNKEILLSQYEDTDPAILALLSGKVDAFVCPKPMLLKKLSELGLSNRFKIVGEPLVELKRGYLMRKTDHVFLSSIIDPALDKLLNSRAYRDIYQKWYGDPEPYFTVGRVLIFSGAGFLALLLIFLLLFSLTISRKNRALTHILLSRKKTEEELRESEERYRTIMENAPVGITIAVGPHMSLRFYNSMFLKMFGYGEQELPKLSITDLHPAEDIGFHIQNLERTMQGLVGLAPASRCIRKDGSVFYCDIVAASMLINGEQGGVGFFLDVSERERAREELRQNEKLAAIGQLAGGIAHDFNNQLTGILGYAEMLQGLLPLDSREQKMANGIISSVQRSAALTRQLLAFARKGKFEEKDIDLHRLVQEVISLASHSIDKRISLEADLRAQKPCVKGDAGQLQNALLNLVLNARDAMENGGRIFIETKMEAIEAQRIQEEALTLNPGTYISLCVSDTGCGMAPEILAHAFEPFFTTKELGKGTGMGLAAVYGTVTNHRGAVTIESSVGIGTVIKIYLPTKDGCIESQEEPLVPINLDEKPGKDRLVLIVDDEELIRNVGSDMLGELGYRVHQAKDGYQAIEYFLEHADEVHAVILDIIMPGLSGQDVFRRLREIRQGLRVIVSSGYSLDGQVQAVMDSGGKAFLHKPFLFSELKAALEECEKPDEERGY